VSSMPFFLREIARLGLTVLDLPTAFWHEMVGRMEGEGLELPRGVRLVILGGEEAQADRVAAWRARVGSGVRLVNSYGPTETTVVATRRELSSLAPGASVPIGRPIPGARAYVLDDFGALVPPGVRGELWIGGLGVARGYLGRPDLTAERFVPDPFAGVPGARLYRTGDLAVLRPDGDLVFAGRADRQIKIRGYRVELGEIEAVLRSHPMVREALVVVREEEVGDRSLVACVVATAGEGASAPWREWMSERLPGFMVPAAFVMLESLPLTPSGKVDRRALGRMVAERRTGDRGSDRLASRTPPRTPVEETLASLFVEVLGAERTG
jgi:acyl-coenzyme A synthetase/AMP-(fatty) acid ligase